MSGGLGLSFIPYIKYLLAPNTRFERDHKIFFGPDGQVAKGESLINYGWGYGGLKEFVKTYYHTVKRSDHDFEIYYENLRKYRENLLKKMSSSKLLPFPLRGLVTAKIHESLFIPILVVDFESIRFKFCQDCGRRWEGQDLPQLIKQNLDTDKLSREIRGMRCTRMTCNHLCGNYENCVLNYTSLEEDPVTERKILNCLSALIKLLREGTEPGKVHECREREVADKSPHKIGKLKEDQKCFERPVRYDLSLLGEDTSIQRHGRKFRINV